MVGGASRLASRIADQLQRVRDRGELTFDTAMLREGRKFPASFRFLDVADDGRVEMYFENQTTDQDLIVVVQPRIGVTADLTVSRGATENTAGTDVSVLNAWERDGEFSNAVRVAGANQPGDYTHADPTLIEDLISGSGQGAGRTAQPVGALTFSVEPGSNALISMTNRSGGSVDRAALVATVYEVTPEQLVSSIRPDDYTDSAGATQR